MRAVLALLAFASCLFAADFPSAFRAIPVAEGLAALTQITTAGDASGRLYVVEQAGRIRVLHNGSVAATPFLDITDRVLAGGERGLLGLAWPPSSNAKRHFYVNYTARPNGETVIARFRLRSDGSTADPASEEVLLRIPQPFSNHNGGMLAFSPRDNHLYVGMGDGGSGGDPQNNAQNPQSLLGKILRLDTEGAQQPPTPQIWASGLRNPWRFSFDRESGDLWIADVGQGRLEEVNFQPADATAGANYGWRRMEGTQCFEPGCSTAGLTLPVFEYSHDLGCSVTGGYVYRGQRYPAMRGVYVAGDYCSGNVWFVRPRAGGGWESRLHGRLLDSLTSFGEDEQGELYAVTASGGVYMLAAGAPAVSATGVVNAASYAAGLTPGSLASIFAPGITTVNGVVSAAAIPLPLELGGASVTVDGIRAPILAAANVRGQEQINFQVPWELAGRDRAQLVVTVGGAASAPVEVELQPAAPGTFAVAQDGRFGYIYATGLGAVAGPPQTGSAGVASPTVSDVSVTVAGAQARVTYAGLSPEFVGVYQVNFELPASAQPGSEVLLRVANRASNAGRL